MQRIENIYEEILRRGLDDVGDINFTKSMVTKVSPPNANASKGEGGEQS